MFHFDIILSILYFGNSFNASFLNFNLSSGFSISSDKLLEKLFTSPNLHAKAVLPLFDAQPVPTISNIQIGNPIIIASNKTNTNPSCSDVKAKIELFKYSSFISFLNSATLL